jgi:hypothetical protein
MDRERLLRIVRTLPLAIEHAAAHGVTVAEAGLEYTQQRPCGPDGAPLSRREWEAVAAMTPDQMAAALKVPT